MHFYTVVILYLHINLSFKLVRAVICAAVFGPFQACVLSVQGRHFAKID